MNRVLESLRAALRLAQSLAPKEPLEGSQLPRGLTPLHAAAEAGNIRLAETLLKQGAEVDARDEFGNTPLSTAVYHARGNGVMIHLLRQYGANPLAANASDVTPVSLARTIANFNVAQFLKTFQMSQSFLIRWPARVCTSASRSRSRKDATIGGRKSNACFLLSSQ